MLFVKKHLEEDLTRETMLIEGKWLKPTHLQEHKTMLDNLVSILSDFEDSMEAVNNPNAMPLPRNANGIVLWDQISVDYLVRWAMINASKVVHKHTVKEENVTPSGTN